jgi:hypothetical protein
LRRFRICLPQEYAGVLDVIDSSTWRMIRCVRQETRRADHVTKYVIFKLFVNHRQRGLIQTYVEPTENNKFLRIGTTIFRHVVAASHEGAVMQARRLYVVVQEEDLTLKGE